jgi:hypothetical protein
MYRTVLPRRMSDNLKTAKTVFDAKGILRGEVVEYPDLGICTLALHDPDNVQVERTRAGSYLFGYPKADGGKTTSRSLLH